MEWLVTSCKFHLPKKCWSCIKTRSSNRPCLTNGNRANGRNLGCRFIRSTRENGKSKAKPGWKEIPSQLSGWSFWTRKKRPARGGRQSLAVHSQALRFSLMISSLAKPSRKNERQQNSRNQAIPNSNVKSEVSS